MAPVDFVNEDNYDEMEKLSRSLFGEAWNRNWCEDGICCVDGLECTYSGSCTDCPVGRV